jgi:hypothetical protein
MWLYIYTNDPRMHSTSFQLFTETYLNVCVDFVESRQTSYNVNNLSDFAYQCRRRHHFEIIGMKWNAFWAFLIILQIRMSNATMISMTSIQDLLTVRTKKFVNKGMDYEEFVINLLVSAVLPSFLNPIHNNSP